MRRIWKRHFAVYALTLARIAMAGVVLLTAVPGCSEIPEPDRGANQSLVEIGELSLEEAERLEGAGRTVDANVAFRRSLWAFRYHEKLTGEQPFLMEEAMDGVERTASRKR